MEKIIVRTKSELKEAIDKKYEEIVVEGSLADKLKTVKKIAKVGRATLAVLATALVAAPFTGGLSFFSAAPIAALTGIRIAVIIAVSVIGLGLILGIYNDYDYIEADYEKGKLVLRKKES